MVRTDYTKCWTLKDELKMIDKKKNDGEWLYGYIDGAKKRKEWIGLSGEAIIAYAENLLNNLEVE